jgi:hypothetical protein
LRQIGSYKQTCPSRPLIHLHFDLSGPSFAFCVSPPTSRQSNALRPVSPPYSPLPSVISGPSNPPSMPLPAFHGLHRRTCLRNDLFACSPFFLSSRFKFNCMETEISKTITSFTNDERFKCYKLCLNKRRSFSEEFCESGTWKAFKLNAKKNLFCKKRFSGNKPKIID